MSFLKRLEYPCLVLAPDRVISSEKSGAVSGEEAGWPAEKQWFDVIDEVSENISILASIRLRLSSLSISGSMVSRVRFCQPCFTLTFANARRSCKVRAIFVEIREW
jgi:hypothetical protein